ncbi:Uncharacterized protein FWK35_00020363, partial [Aphis craccivora]
TKEKKLLVYEEYIFEKHYTKNEKTYWKCNKCIKYNMYKCRDRAHTINDETASIQVISTPLQIVANTISTVSSQAIAGALSTVATMKKTVQRITRCKNAKYFIMRDFIVNTYKLCWAFV